MDRVRCMAIDEFRLTIRDGRLQYVLLSKVIAVLVVSMLSGCLSVKQGQRQFRDEMDSLIGHRMDNSIRGEVIATNTVDGSTREIVFGTKDGCQWAFAVDQESQEIQAWRFISDPSLCYYETDWFGPW